MTQPFFITGTDTGVGKTVLTALLVKFLRERGENAAALKPVCSGGRADAQKLLAAMGGALTLDEINPWHFRTPIAPALAARKENQRVKLSQVLAHVRAMQKRFEVLLIEGAGGLMSPLGENFDSRDLIVALRATPIIVAQNKIGAVNHVLLTLEALPKNLRANARVVLMSQPDPDASAETNPGLLAELTEANTFLLPWLEGNLFDIKSPRVRRTLRALAGF